MLNRGRTPMPTPLRSCGSWSRPSRRACGAPQDEAVGLRALRKATAIRAAWELPAARDLATSMRKARENPTTSDELGFAKQGLPIPGMRRRWWAKAFLVVTGNRPLTIKRRPLAKLNGIGGEKLLFCVLWRIRKRPVHGKIVRGKPRSRVKVYQLHASPSSLVDAAFCVTRSLFLQVNRLDRYTEFQSHRLRRHGK